MEESILLTVKKMIGGADGSYDHFDNDLILHINTFLAVLDQLMADSNKPFRITGEDETWEDLGFSDDELGLIKDYIAIRTRLVFDPPSSSFVLDALKKTADELEFRILVSFDHR